MIPHIQRFLSPSLWLLPVIFLAGPVLAQDPNNVTPAKQKPAVKEISPGVYGLGKIRIEAKTRRITFPAHINQTEGNIEFVLVNEKGKIHESLLKTPVAPMELQIALLLARYKISADRVFWKLLPEEKRGNAAPPKENPLSRLGLWLDYADPVSGKKKSVPVQNWVFNARDRIPLRKQSWTFNGSSILAGDKSELADEASMIAVYLDRFSIVNFDGKGNDNDDVWFPAPNVVPPVGTEVTFRIEPAPGGDASKRAQPN